MAENKKGVLVYADWIDHFEGLTDEEAGLLIKHFFRYVNDLNPIAPDRIIEIAFAPIKASLKRDLDKWEKTISERSVNGRMGNLKKYHIDLYNKVSNSEITLEEAEEVAKHRKASPPDSNPTKNVANVADNVSVSVNVNNIEERKVNFANSLKPYLSIYGKDMLNDFYAYWTEHGDKDKKFRSEKQTSFSIERRLETWKRNESKFGIKSIKTDKL
jgi:hypothetical protein